MISFIHNNQKVFIAAPENDHIGVTAKTTSNFYEADLLSFAGTLLHENDLVIDVGANIGNHTVYFALIKKCNVVSYEPNPEAIKFLRKNIEDNKIDDKVYIRSKALGDQPGSGLSQARGTDNLGMTRIIPTENGPLDITTLDSENFKQKISLIKIDTEGMELSVLKGAKSTIEKDRPILICEAATEEDYEGITSFLSNIDYEPFDVFCATPTYIYFPAKSTKEKQRFIRAKANLRSLQANEIKLKVNQLNNKFNKALSQSNEEINFSIEKLSLAIDKLQKTVQSELKRNSQDKYKIYENINDILDTIKQEKLKNQQDKYKIYENINDILDTIKQEKLKNQYLLVGPIFRNMNKLQEGLRRLKHYFIKNSPSSNDILSRIEDTTQNSPPVVQKWPSHIVRMPRLERNIDIERTKNSIVADGALVSIIMTAYNASSYIEKAITSILCQTYKNIELIVVDDASTDTTLDVVNVLSQKHANIRIISSPINRGTYWSKNLGIQECKGDVIAFMDSDDYSLPTRIEVQLSALQKANVVACMCHYVRKGDGGQIILNRGLRERPGVMTIMAKRQIFDDIGFFDTVRTSADAEFVDRVRSTYGSNSVTTVPLPLYEALVRESSLTNSPNNVSSLEGNSEGLLFLSPPRRNYVNNYKDWHTAIISQGKTPWMPFPLTSRPFKVDTPLKVNPCRFDHDLVIAFMASFPLRRAQLERSIASLLPQVDRLYIYLNDYETSPDFLNDERIIALPAQQMENLRDVGKIFHMQSAPHGYYFTVDDDIEYPYDYCDTMIRAIEKYDRKAIVGVHGVIIEQPVTRYFSEKRQVMSFKNALAHDKAVNVLGTGTTAFHSEAFTPHYASMPKGMLDIGFAVAARKAKIPMVAIARPEAWLREIKIEDQQTPTLYHEFKDNDIQQTELLQTIEDWNPIIPKEIISH